MDYRGGLVTANAFHLRSTIGTMERKSELDVVTDIIDGWGYDKSEDTVCDGKFCTGKWSYG